MKRSKPAERKTKKRRGRSEVFCFKESLTSLVVFGLLVSLNWAGLAAIGQTFGYLNDTENSSENSFVASTLDFSLSGDNFSPLVLPWQNATSTIALQNDGLLDFIYGARVEAASGTLCNFLELEDDLTNSYQPLNSFVSATTTFSATSSVIFDARLTSASKGLQNQTCEFKFVFDGEQLAGAGFSDSEEISRTIASGAWPSVVISKVYYDVDANHGTENKNEWIELYNPLNQDIDLKNWVICDNYDCRTINSHSIIKAQGYALISHDASTWNYWDVPAGVEKINLGGSFSLSNDDDMVALKNPQGNIVDQMNWGTPSPSWDNYNSNLWNPGLVPAGDGRMAARVPTGLDTDTVSDWKNLSLPIITMIYPVGGEVWYVGHDYDILWTATNPNGDDNDLSIDIYYSKNSGATWAAIATSTENDGSYNWLVPLFIEPGHYYVPSSHARIKVKATGPENFMVQVATSSRDFCPPIDYDALGPEDQQLVDQLVSEGAIDESEVIRGGIKDEEQPLEITEEKDATEEQITDETTEISGSESNSSAGVSENDLSCPVGESGTFNSVEQTGQDETIDETQTAEPQEEKILIETETLPETEIIIEQSEEQTATAEQPAVQETTESEQPLAGDTTGSDQETTNIETAPAIEAQPVATPSDSGGLGDVSGGDGSGASGDTGVSGSVDSAVAPADSGSAGEN